MTVFIENISVSSQLFANHFSFVSRETSRSIGAQSSFELFGGPEITRSPHAIPKKAISNGVVSLGLVGFGVSLAFTGLIMSRKSVPVPFRYDLMTIIGVLLLCTGVIVSFSETASVSRETP